MMLKIKSVIFVGVAIGVLSLLCCSIDATTYTVGDGLGWVEPLIVPIYSICASTHTFVKGDVLVFKFNTGYHDVAQVTKQSYIACNKTSSISIYTKSPVTIPLQKKGTRYFISTINNDCEQGLKLEINVLTKLPPAPPPGLPPAIAPAGAPLSGISAPPLAGAAPIVPDTPSPPSRNSAPLALACSSLFSVFLSLILMILW